MSVVYLITAISFGLAGRQAAAECLTLSFFSFFFFLFFFSFSGAMSVAV